MPTPKPPHLIVLGGFLGAGKTTAVRALAESLTAKGLRIGVITNDQGSDLVDTQLLRGCGIDTREVTGGCFCCRFDALLDAAAVLTSDMAPDVLIAEAVGSCTDLVATVATPVRQLFGDRFTMAPLSVLVDPGRARALLGLDAAEPFASDVAYIYRKQLEEAELIVMTKCDRFTDDEVNEVGNLLAHTFPRGEVLAISSRDGLHVEEWLQQLLYATVATRASVVVDYDAYAAGESRLGWLNASILARAEHAFDANALLLALAQEVQQRLHAGDVTIAHLKLSFVASEASEASTAGVASVNVARNASLPETGVALAQPSRAGRILLNLRAESEPQRLEDVVRFVVASRGPQGDVELVIERLEAFAPARPQPTHRITTS